MRKLKLSTARNLMVLMVDSTDHVTGKTLLTLTITASKNGDAFGSITPTVTERGSGWYSLALTSAHLDTLGDLALHITGAAADPADVLAEVVAYDPQAATNLGLSNLDVASSALETAIATRAAPGDAMALTGAAVDAILDDVVEGAFTLRQFIRLFAAALFNKSSGGGTATIIFRDRGDTKARISATVDADGNRTAVVVDGT